MWFWVKDQAGDQSSRFEFARDNVYGGTIFLGIGSSTMVVIAFTMISTLVGKYTVSVGEYTVSVGEYTVSVGEYITSVEKYTVTVTVTVH